MSSQRIGKYACLEIERRYLLEKLPDDLDTDGWLIIDQYIPNTRLRLRHMKSILGNERIYKLTQKYQSETQDSTQTTITNMYLTEAEFRIFEKLGEQELRKRRHKYRWQKRQYSIDVFEGPHQGLILAEIEFENESELAENPFPQFAIKDVTDNPFFTGGHLVAMSEELFRQGLEKYL